MTDYQDWLTTLVPRFDREIETKGFFDAICPNHGEQTALQLQDLGRWEDAATAWQAGADASIGHNRTARYEAAAAHCRLKAHKLAQENSEN